MNEKGACRSVEMECGAQYVREDQPSATQRPPLLVQILVTILQVQV